jgi:hypothetical protein
MRFFIHLTCVLFPSSLGVTRSGKQEKGSQNKLALLLYLGQSVHLPKAK